MVRTITHSLGKVRQPVYARRQHKGRTHKLVLTEVVCPTGLRPIIILVPYLHYMTVSVYNNRRLPKLPEICDKYKYFMNRSQTYQQIPREHGHYV